MSRGILRASAVASMVLLSVPAWAVWPPDPTDIRGNPPMASTFYGCATTLLPLFTTFKPDETDDISEELSRASGEVSEIGSEFSSSDYRVLRLAAEDAAVFVASAGELRGARLEAALRLLRRQPSRQQASDLALAQQLLVLTTAR
ncbi:DUF2388 domain-containing protein [Pseudomonas mangrovi]|nr:DUF2388 domain-containing protein [Pseudomonas mangrovi]